MKSIDAIIAVAVVLSACTLQVLVSYMIGGWAVKYSPFSSGFNAMSIPNMDGKVVIVTGVNSGIGYITAKELVRCGATVIGTVRSMDKASFATELNKHSRGKLIPMKLDLASLASVKAFHSKFAALELPLHVAVWNAGVMMTPPGLTEDGVETQFATNFLGHYLLTRLLMSEIVRCSTRVVHVSSLAHWSTYKLGIDPQRITSLQGYSFFQAYGQSKLANILFSNELSKHLVGSGATSNACHPGSIQTQLPRNLYEHYILPSPDSMFSALGTEVQKGVTWVAGLTLLMTPEDGALTQLELATSPSVANVSGAYFNPIGVRVQPSPHALNETLGRELWDMAEGLVADFL